MGQPSFFRSSKAGSVLKPLTEPSRVEMGMVSTSNASSFFGDWMPPPRGEIVKRYLASVDQYSLGSKEACSTPAAMDSGVPTHCFSFVRAGIIASRLGWNLPQAASTPFVLPSRVAEPMAFSATSHTGSRYMPFRPSGATLNPGFRTSYACHQMPPGNAFLSLLRVPLPKFFSTLLSIMSPVKYATRLLLLWGQFVSRTLSMAGTEWISIDEKTAYGSGPLLTLSSSHFLWIIQSNLFGNP
mmetsp:Transcript_6058/g.17078  ORF Transcript_6058/g.17078 Transcript_6058/m.17078 type:complete len:241 (-) Transcript_6058:723-1445(-)